MPLIQSASLFFGSAPVWVAALLVPEQPPREMSSPKGLRPPKVLAKVPIRPAPLVQVPVPQSPNVPATPAKAATQQAQIQKMMIFMPFIFGLTLYNYAAGLSLYMITSSTLGIVEQTVIKKLWPPPGMKPPGAKPAAALAAAT